MYHFEQFKFLIDPNLSVFSLIEHPKQKFGKRDPWTRSTYPVFTDAQLAEYNQKGYLIVRGLLSKEELPKFRTTLTNDPEVTETNAYTVEDSTAKKVHMTIINSPGKNLLGALGRSGRIIDNFERLFQDECYHYHFKTIRKEPKVGGSFEWHQDYGYWYPNGCVTPNMGTVFIAIDKCTNGKIFGGLICNRKWFFEVDRRQSQAR